MSYAPQGRKEVSPPPGTYAVGRNRDENQPHERKSTGACERLAKGAPVHPSEEKHEQDDRKENPKEEPPSPRFHGASDRLMISSAHEFPSPLKRFRSAGDTLFRSWLTNCSCNR